MRKFAFSILLFILTECNGGGVIDGAKFFQGLEVPSYLAETEGVAVRAWFPNESDVEAVYFYAGNRFAGADYLPPFGVIIPSSWRVELGNSFLLRAEAFSISQKKWFSLTVPASPFTKETAAVTIKFFRPTSGEIIRDQFVDTLASIPERVVQRVDFYLDSILWASDYSSPFQSLWNSKDYLNGEHLLSAAAYFFVGSENVQMVKTIPVVISNLSAAPSFSFITPSDNAEINGEVLLQVESEEYARLRRVRFVLQDTEIFDDTRPPFELLLDSRKYPDGDYVIIAEGERDFGGSLMDGVLVHFRNGNPIQPVQEFPVQFLSPSDGAILTGTVPVRIMYSSLKIEEVRFFLDRTPLYADFFSPFEFWWDTTPYAKTGHLLRLIARDRSGFFYSHQIRITLQ